MVGIFQFYKALRRTSTSVHIESPQAVEQDRSRCCIRRIVNPQKMLALRVLLAVSSDLKVEDRCLESLRQD